MWLLSQIKSVTTLGWYQVILIGEQRQMYVHNLPMSQQPLDP